MAQRTGAPIAGIPEVEFGDWLLEALFAVGPVRITGEGELPLSWPEVLAYAQATDALDEPWEFEAVIRMSRAYLEEKTAGSNPLRVAPIERKG